MASAALSAASCNCILSALLKSPDSSSARKLSIHSCPRPGLTFNSQSHQHTFSVGVTFKHKKGRNSVLVMAQAGSGVVEEKLGIRVEKNPCEERLKELNVRSWGKWGCPASEFPWTYDAKETCYLLKGRVKVTPAGATSGVEFGAGDLVVFPKGMSCTWTVTEAVDKHYLFEY
eukprot:jgi/Mesen1/9913/ME000070S09202